MANSKPKAEIRRLIKKTSVGRHAWYEVFFPIEKKIGVIKKPIQ